MVAAASMVTNLNFGLRITDYFPVMILTLLAAIVSAALLMVRGKPIGTGRIIAGQALTLAIMALWLTLS